MVMNVQRKLVRTWFRLLVVSVIVMILTFAEWRVTLPILVHWVLVVVLRLPLVERFWLEQPFVWWVVTFLHLVRLLV